MKNTRGLSAIVATLIIILLTLVAVGIIWVVIRNMVQSGAEQIDISTKCTAVTLSAVKVNVTTPEGNTYAVTLHRGSDSQEDLGVKVNIFNSTDNGGVQVWGAVGDLDALGTVTKSVTGVTGANKIEYTSYFTDDSGNDQLCSPTQTFTF